MDEFREIDNQFLFDPGNRKQFSATFNVLSTPFIFFVVLVNIPD